MNSALPRLIMVRHGQTDSNVERRFQGQLDVPLNETGMLQAKVMAEQVASLAPTALITSDLIRARATADAIAGACGLEPVIEPGLREIYAGEWEGMLHSEVEAKFPEEFAAWKRHEDIRRGVSGETERETGERGATAMLAHIKKYGATDTVVFVAHGIVIQACIWQLRKNGVLDFAGAVPHLGNAEWICINGSV